LVEKKIKKIWFSSNNSH